jgi:hypothetical protein
MKPSFDIEAHCDNLAKSGTEHAHQRAFFQYLNFLNNTNPEYKSELVFAIPNGGKRDPITAARLKAEGVKAGVPDIMNPVPNGYYVGLFIEMKKPEKGSVSPAQTEYHENLRVLGYAVAVCYGWRAARQCYMSYILGNTCDTLYQ